jgi:PPOX class probable F420-dependent enzyme
VSGGIDSEGRLVMSTYPQRAKVANLRRRPFATACVLSDEWNGAWVQVEGPTEVLDLPDALEPLVEYYRSISGEHPDWDEYRDAMRRQGKSLLRMTIERWGPIATGGFPPDLADE